MRLGHDKWRVVLRAISKFLVCCCRQPRLNGAYGSFDERTAHPAIDVPMLRSKRRGKKRSPRTHIDGRDWRGARARARAEDEKDAEKDDKPPRADRWPENTRSASRGCTRHKRVQRITYINTQRTRSSVAVHLEHERAGEPRLEATRGSAPRPFFILLGACIFRWRTCGSSRSSAAPLCSAPFPRSSTTRASSTLYQSRRPGAGLLMAKRTMSAYAITTKYDDKKDEIISISRYSWEASPPLRAGPHQLRLQLSYRRCRNKRPAPPTTKLYTLDGYRLCRLSARALHFVKVIIQHVIYINYRFEVEACFNILQRGRRVHERRCTTKRKTWKARARARLSVRACIFLLRATLSAVYVQKSHRVEHHEAANEAREREATWLVRSLTEKAHVLLGLFLGARNGSLLESQRIAELRRRTRALPTTTRCYVVTKFELKCIISMSRVGSRAAVSRSAAHLPRTNFYMVHRTSSRVHQGAIGELLLRDRYLRSSLQASYSPYRYLAVGRWHDRRPARRLCTSTYKRSPCFPRATYAYDAAVHARPEHCSLRSVSP
ncbi:unnamed protein product [Trichogramma brassicae]|uniref:Uncharacterized protein n=1 Tax=Trichogramma brassicae TaxID=86971 RepID=A0A6H5ISM2_9HYME|nr:unnamed protein product [Trichogramma brassicae]